VTFADFVERDRSESAARDRVRQWTMHHSRHPLGTPASDSSLRSLSLSLSLFLSFSLSPSLSHTLSLPLHPSSAVAPRAALERLL
jgi:hypothetical protein